MARALFITFEGIEGSGKSSQIVNVAEYFTQKKYKVLKTREPGGTVIAEKIRNQLIHQESEQLSHRAELLLLLAARAQHVDELIQKNLNAVDLILCDRFTDSTLAYQGGGRNMDMDWLKTINQFATNGLVPDLTFLMDIDISNSQTRLDNRRKRSEGSHVDRFESEDVAFHEKIRKTYLALAQSEPKRFVVLNAMDKPQVILKIIVEKIEKIIKPL